MQSGPTVLANLGLRTSLFSLVPWNIAVDASGKVYLARYGLVQRVENGAVVTVAGADGQSGTADGAGTQVQPALRVERRDHGAHDGAEIPRPGRDGVHPGGVR